MNISEKNIVRVLFEGGFIVNNGPYGIRVLDKKTNPIMKATEKRFRKMKGLLKKNKKGLWVLSPKEILKLNGNSWVKQQYKSLRVKK
jgi:hypothetical protein